MNDNFRFSKGIFGIDITKVTRVEKCPALNFSVCFFFGNNDPYIVVPCENSKEMENFYKNSIQEFQKKFDNVIDFTKYKRRK